MPLLPDSQASVLESDLYFNDFVSVLVLELMVIYGCGGCCCENLYPF